MFAGRVFSIVEELYSNLLSIPCAVINFIVVDLSSLKSSEIVVPFDNLKLTLYSLPLCFSIRLLVVASGVHDVMDP